MNGVARGLALAGLQGVLVASLGGTFLWERATRPRAWAKTAPVDPRLPVRGRYLALGLELPLTGLPPERQAPSGSAGAPRPLPYVRVRLVPEGSVLKAVYQDEALGPWGTGTGLEGGRVEWIHGQPFVRIQEPVLFFIPESGPDPSIRTPGQELWVEVTLPRRGPPRPIRLGIRREGILTPWKPQS